MSTTPSILSEEDKNRIRGSLGHIGYQAEELGSLIQKCKGIRAAITNGSDFIAKSYSLVLEDTIECSLDSGAFDISQITIRKCLSDLESVTFGLKAFKIVKIGLPWPVQGFLPISFTEYDLKQHCSELGAEIHRKPELKENISEGYQNRLLSFRNQWNALFSEIENVLREAKGISPILNDGCRLNVDLSVSREQVLLDGKAISVTETGAQFVLELIKAGPKGIVSGKSFSKKYDHLAGADRPDRIKKRLPDQIKELVDSKSGGGYWLKPGAWSD